MTAQRSGAGPARLGGYDPASASGYGDHPPRVGFFTDTSVCILLDEPEVYGLPPDPVVTTRDLPAMWRHVGAAAGTLAAAAAAAFAAALLGQGGRGHGPPAAARAWLGRRR